METTPEVVVDAPKKNIEPIIEMDAQEGNEIEQNDFLEFALSAEVHKALEKLKFTKATPVQKACIPLLLEKDTDIVALAKTGTGKTAAFGLPVIEKITAGEGLQALVLCPTRELAQQVAAHIRNFGEFKKIKVTTVVGGESYERQIKSIRANPEVLVSTPGRLVDLMEQKIVNLKDVKYLVLDEADEMLSFGFEEALETIWKASAKTDLKTWLFSATMSRAIKSLSAKYLKDAEEVTLNTHTEKTNVESFACVIFEEDKEDALSLLIKNTKDFYGIIFATTKKQVAELELRLRSLGLDVDSLHGDKVQADRTRTIERMKSKRTKILVATDVAARGLDIQDLTHVVNFEIPWDTETYTHRVGRTARAGKAGIVWTMVKPKESGKLSRFERALNFKFKGLKIPLVEDVQINMKMNWLKQIADIKMHEKDTAKFEKAIDQLDGMSDLTTETKQWLAKALNYIGQGEELRMKQPRSLELRERGESTGHRSEGNYDDRGGEGRGERRGFGGGFRGNDRGGFRGGFSRDRNDRGGDRQDRGGGDRPAWGFRGRDDRGGGFAPRNDDRAPRDEAPRAERPRDDRGGDRPSFSSDRPERSSSSGDDRGFRGGRGGGAGRPSGGGSRFSGGGRPSSRPSSRSRD
jgi:ATP-dependent RNA helicase DeaD